MNERPPLQAVLGTLIGALLFIGGLILYVPYAICGWRIAPALLGLDPLRWVGGLLLMLSIPPLLDFLVRFVREGHGTPMPMAPPRRLVVTGPYRFVRNPAYLAAFCSLVGQGLLFGSVSVLVYALVFWIAFHLFVVGYEEPVLREKFGPEYEEYRRRVPRWWPRFGRGR